MAEQTKGRSPVGDGLDTDAAQTQFGLKRVFLKDLSFEMPMGVQTFTRQWQPQVNQDIATEVNKIDAEHYEVVLRLTVTVAEADDTAYLIEVQQGGIFLVSGLPDNQLAQVLNTHCPNILFPYARELIDSISVRGGFPALMLPPINFEALFQRALAEQQAAQQPPAADKLS